MFQLDRSKKMPHVSLTYFPCTLDLNFTSFDGENMSPISFTDCDHELTTGLANYRGSPMTTGSYQNSHCYNKTELYDFKTDQWTYADPYPAS